jgi:hypothetical protein
MKNADKKIPSLNRKNISIKHVVLYHGPESLKKLGRDFILIEKKIKLCKT